MGSSLHHHEGCVTVQRRGLGPGVGRRLSGSSRDQLGPAHQFEVLIPSPDKAIHHAPEASRKQGGCGLQLPCGLRLSSAWRQPHHVFLPCRRKENMVARLSYTVQLVDECVVRPV